MIQSLYRDRRVVWLARVSRYNRLYRDRRKVWPLGVSRYNVATLSGLCCDKAEEPATRRSATRQGTPVTRQGGGGGGGGHDTVSCAPRYSPKRATTWRRAHGLGAVGVQPGFRVCTWCTQPSFGLSALFQSLFGPLFINTIHKFFRKKIKIIKIIKSNKIKSNLLKMKFSKIIFFLLKMI